MRKHLLALFVCFCCYNMGFSQQDPMFTKYMFNTLSYNPAYAGSLEFMSIRALYRNQWLDLEGAPETQTITAHTPLSDRIGVGLSILNDVIGVHATSSINGAYTYRFEFGDGKLSLGVQAGAYNFRSDYDKLTYREPQGDDALFGYIQDNQWQLNFGAGVYYYSKRFYFGFSVPHLINQELRRTTPQSDLDQISRVAASYRHYYFATGGAIPINGDMLVFKPSILVKSVGLFSNFVNDGTDLTTIGAPVEFDIDLSLFFYETFWVGMSFRSAVEAFIGQKSSHDSVDIWASVYLNNGIRVGAAYDYPINKLGNYNNGSFEVMLGYDFNYNMKKIQTPRYF